MPRLLPPLATRRSFAHPILGSALTSLVGREADAEDIIATITAPETRLATLVGPGGIGKTRLALEVASREDSSFPGGVHVALLSEVEDPGYLLPVIAAAIGLGPGQADDLADALIDALGGDPRLLVLDNLEHLLDAAPSLVPLLLGAPALTILATSRAPLNLTGEHVIPVQPLAIPDPDHLTSLDALRDYAAIRLFEERARAAAPGFEITPRNGPIVARICQQLDGIPLAIELAAAQSSVLSPAALLSRIEDHLPYPLKGPRNAPSNRRTMRDTIDWSYTLISPAAQAIFRAASVFPGSFTVDALAAVARPITDDDAPDIMATVAQLHGHSLLATSPSRDVPRFRMLRTIRRYALDRAGEASEIDALRDRHAAHYLQIAEDGGHASISPRAETILATLDDERPNLLVALEWFRTAGMPETLLRLAVALSSLWIERGHYREAAEWLRRSIDLAPDAPRPLRARALVALGLLSGFRTDPEAAGELFDQGMAALVEEGDAETIAIARIWQGGIALRAGHLDAAEDAFGKALAAAANLPAGPVAATLSARVMSNLAVLVHEQGDFDEAARLLRSALETYRTHADTLGMARAHRDLGDLLRDRGDFAGALEEYRSSLSCVGDTPDLRVVLGALQGCALALAVWGEGDTAARLLGAAEILGDDLGPYAVVPTDQAAHRRTLAILRSSMEPAELLRAWDAGRMLLVAEAIDIVRTTIPPSDAQGNATDEVRLSDREREVLGLVAEGCSDREIAARLFLSVRTVEAHMLRIRTRFGVRTRTAAVIAAIASGQLDPSGPNGD